MPVGSLPVPIFGVDECLYCITEV